MIINRGETMWVFTLKYVVITEKATHNYAPGTRPLSVSEVFYSKHACLHCQNPSTVMTSKIMIYHSTFRLDFSHNLHIAIPTIKYYHT